MWCLVCSFVVKSFQFISLKFKWVRLPTPALLCSAANWLAGIFPAVSPALASLGPVWLFVLLNTNIFKLSILLCHCCLISQHPHMLSLSLTLNQKYAVWNFKFLFAYNLHLNARICHKINNQQNSWLSARLTARWLILSAVVIHASQARRVYWLCAILCQYMP